MTVAQAYDGRRSTEGESMRTSPSPLRLWPGVVAVVLQWLVRFVVPMFAPEAVPFGVIGGMIGGLVIVVWWLFFSRAPWVERVGARHAHPAPVQQRLIQVVDHANRWCWSTTSCWYATARRWSPSACRLRGI